MSKTLRYLAFFAVGDVLLAVMVVLILLPLWHLWLLIDATWTTAFNPAYEPYGVRAAWTIYRVKVEAMGDASGFLLGTLILPGLFGAFFMARESLRQPGWWFWRWR